MGILLFLTFLYMQHHLGWDWSAWFLGLWVFYLAAHQCRWTWPGWQS